MGQTMVEKIMQKHSDEDAEPGKIIWIDIDIRSARDFGGANVVKNMNTYYPGEKVHDRSKTYFTFDCNVPANTIAYANNQHICRKYAKGEEIKVYDVDAGIGSHVLIEEGLLLPGGTGVGTDSHLNILGSIGAFGQGMGDQDIAFVFKAGKTWFEVPETIRIDVDGQLPADCSARDLTLKTVGTLGTKTALGKAQEFFGPTIDSLDLSGRITLSSMATEMSAIIALLQPNEAVLQECSEARGSPVEGIAPDPDATYSANVTVDINGLKPQISRPGKPHDVVDVETVNDVPVDSVFIGSCTNGRYEDIKAAAMVVKGKKIKPGVFGSVVPATRKGYIRLMKDGILEILVDAGFLVSNPGCGGCASGQIGMTGEGQVQISTSNRNYTGKQGAGFTYLASPETAAASAIMGRIATAEEVV
ncbi:MAG: 3-isopropylmalate dehydratase large subunit [Thermoplasmata archaeon]|nr:3-isopropylmalate dehydratase large subunit [Thermoplasmata archaeon]